MRQVDDLGAMYLAAENARVSTHTAALITIDPAALPGGRLTIDRLRDVVRERLPLIPAFQWRVVRVPLGLDRPYWVEADSDLDYHVQEIALPSPGDDDLLREQVARIFSRPLDRSRPLWEMYLIQGLAGGRAAVLTKVHHAAADGRAGAQMVATLTDTEPHPPPAAGLTAPPVPPPPSSVSMLARGLAGFVRQPWRAVSGVPAMLSGLDELPVFGTMPGARLVGASLALVRRERRHTPVARAPRTSFNRRISRHRRIGIATLALDDVKFVKNRFTVSVNDVVMALAAGALRRWLLERDELPAQPLTAVVPVSLRGDRSVAFGNALSAVVVPIPTGVDDPVARLNGAHAAMLAALRDLGTTAPDALVDTVRLVPPVLFVQTAQLLTRLNAWPVLPPAMNVNISNVPGPQQTLYLAGAKVESVVPLAGITDGLGLNITVLSYCGRLHVGVVADRDQVPDVQRIADWTAEELALLVKAADR
ncbi:WS/DGAT/MGAT family acyltransferase [Kribbella voronezhensis]|uniref:Diacylglycerol O-acyltransferase n=1 Tax=Kribbella voronezhensis TaxID=2512212 RepID=A0A4R7SY63_9ACTN|nr:wax ester/triacylglycerol synthase family O-acyltransferase [Kribbella voronezhensis]TDU83869.1 WS/DGAT/MGAT family acyltransferase [Kribbella voronezhensis]